MPNVACNTSSFLKSQCKYVRTAGVRELKPDKQQHDDMRRGRNCRRWVFLRSLEHACLRADVRENMCWSFWRVKKNDPVLDMEWNKLMLACEGSCQQKKTLKRYFFFFSFLFCQQKRSDRINSWCQTRTMERKSQLKTIKVKLFSVSLISLSQACFRVLDGSNDEELVNPTQWRKDVLDVVVASATSQLLWGLSGDGVIVCCTLPPVTSSVCLGPVMLQEVTTRSDWWRKLTESWAHSSGLLTDMMEWFLSQKRAIMDFSPLPCPLKYWRLFLWIILSYTCTGFIHYLLFPFHFINVSFTAFSSTRFSSGAFFVFLFCCGLDSACLCLKSQVQCLQVEFEPSSSP